MGYATPTVTKETKTIRKWTIDREVIEQILVEHLKLDGLDVDFDWDVSQGDLVKGVLVTEVDVTTTSK